MPVEQRLDLANLSRLAFTNEGCPIVLHEIRAASGHEGLRQGKEVLALLLCKHAPDNLCRVTVDDPTHGYEPPILGTLRENPDESSGNEGPGSAEVGVTLWDLGGRPCLSTEPPLANNQEHVRTFVHQRVRYQNDALQHLSARWGLPDSC